VSSRRLERRPCLRLDLCEQGQDFLPFRLERALNGNATGELRRTQFERLRLEGSRFNVGFVWRTFNDPMFALQVVDPLLQSRFLFKLAGRETVAGVDAWKLTWTEHRAGTLIVDGEGWDLFSTGSTCVRKEDGVVVKTRLEVENRRRRTKGEVTVTYQHEPRLNLWLPYRMEEHYVQRADKTALPARLKEEIDCVAMYSNFRRFETEGRIVAPTHD